MRELSENEKRNAERVYELAQQLPPEGQRLLVNYGEALRDARELYMRNQGRSA